MCLNHSFMVASDKKKSLFFRIPPGNQQRDGYSSWQQLNCSPCSPYMDGNRNSTSRSLSQFESTISLNDKKVKVSQNIQNIIKHYENRWGFPFPLVLQSLLLQEMCPEFIRMLDEPQVVLELPSSIVVSEKWQ